MRISVIVAVSISCGVAKRQRTKTELEWCGYFLQEEMAQKLAKDAFETFKKGSQAVPVLSELGEMVEGMKSGDYKKVAFNAGILGWTAMPSWSSSKDQCGYFTGGNMIKILTIQTAK